MRQKKEEEPKERQRREYAAKGSRSQKMMTFRVDYENLEFLESKVNKGRYINDLLAQARAQELRDSEE